MTHSQTDSANATGSDLTFARLWRPLTEWLIWIILGAVVYSQTGAFDKEIAEYAFGATGWPRSLCIAVFFGATGQLAYQILQMSRGAEEASSEEGDGKAIDRPTQSGPWRLLQRLGIFVFPLIYLYVTPSLGFYVTTPFFVLGMLLILEVKSPLALATVTGTVYGLFLLIFTRFFYVAVPVGQIQAFYDINNAIIVFARTGL